MMIFWLVLKLEISSNRVIIISLNKLYPTLNPKCVPSIVGMGVPNFEKCFWSSAHQKGSLQIFNF
jgi:hypothetical protein